MGNWLSPEPGLSSVDTVLIPSGQRNDNRRGGEETEEKGRNRTAVEGRPISKHAVSLIKRKCDNNQNPGREV